MLSPGATDIAATILSAAGVPHLNERFAGRPILPMTGKNLLPLLADAEARIYEEDESLAANAGNRALFKGDFKLHQSQPPLGDGQWRLYNIATDPGETNDLAELELNDFAPCWQIMSALPSRTMCSPYPRAIVARARSLVTASKHDLATRSSR